MLNSAKYITFRENTSYHDNVRAVIVRARRACDSRFWYILNFEILEKVRHGHFCSELEAQTSAFARKLNLEFSIF